MVTLGWSGSVVDMRGACLVGGLGQVWRVFLSRRLDGGRGRRKI
jgi:hypothetical protein